MSFSVLDYLPITVLPSVKFSLTTTVIEVYFHTQEFFLVVYRLPGLGSALGKRDL